MKDLPYMVFLCIGILQSPFLFFKLLYINQLWRENYTNNKLRPIFNIGWMPTVCVDTEFDEYVRGESNIFQFWHNQWIDQRNLIIWREIYDAKRKKYRELYPESRLSVSEIEWIEKMNEEIEDEKRIHEPFSKKFNNYLN